jgi:hypothetical protein
MNDQFIPNVVPGKKTNGSVMRVLVYVLIGAIVGSAAGGGAVGWYLTNQANGADLDARTQAYLDQAVADALEDYSDQLTDVQDDISQIQLAADERDESAVTTSYTNVTLTDYSTMVQTVGRGSSCPRW